jgi:hypothetical protein
MSAILGFDASKQSSTNTPQNQASTSGDNTQLQGSASSSSNGSVTYGKDARNVGNSNTKTNIAVGKGGNYTYNSVTNVSGVQPNDIQSVVGSLLASSQNDATQTPATVQPGLASSFDVGNLLKSISKPAIYVGLAIVVLVMIGFVIWYKKGK